MDFIYQIIALAGLLLTVWMGFGYWIKPRAVQPAQQGLLLLVVLTFAGGLLGAIPWWLDLPASFSWDLPPLASRMLASASLSFAVLNFLVLQHPSQNRVKLALWMLFIYLAPLTVAVLLLHLDRFDSNAPITYAFFVIVLLMLGAAGWYLGRPVTILPNTEIDLKTSSQAVQLWLGLVGIITGLWGLALFATDDGFSDLIWVWRGDWLTSQLIGVMLLTITVGIVIGIRHTDTARLMLWAMMVYGVGLALASLWNTLADKPIKMSYVVVFGGAALGSSLLLWKERNE